MAQCHGSWSILSHEVGINQLIWTGMVSLDYHKLVLKVDSAGDIMHCPFVLHWLNHFDLT